MGTSPSNRSISHPHGGYKPSSTDPLPSGRIAGTTAGNTVSSDSPRQFAPPRIISRPSPVLQNPVWPAELLDHQFDPAKCSPIETPEKANAPTTPTDKITVDAGPESAADLDTTREEYAADPEYLAPLTAHDEQSQQEEPQISAPADTQDEAQELTATVKHVADAEGTPAPEDDNPDDTAEPDPKDETVTESDVVNEAVDQTLPPKTALERGEEWKSLFRVLTEDGPPEIKERALAQFTSRLDEFKGAMLGKTLEQRAKIVSATVGIIHPLAMRADAYRCLCAIMIGELANNFKKDVPHGDWADMARKYFPQIEPRDLQHSMRLANVRKAARYCHLGKTKLIALVAIASKSPFNRADDPIGMVLAQAHGTPHILPEEYEQLAGAAIAEITFKKKGLVIDLDVTRDIYISGEEITDKDIAEMLAWQDRHEKGESKLTPTDFLRTILKNDGKRVFELTHPNEKKGMSKGKAQEKPKTPAIPDINSTFEKTRETVQLALDKLEPLSLKVDKELYHTLMTTLTTFGATVFPS